MKRFISIILIFGFLISLTSCTQSKKEYSFFGMNTLMSVTFYNTEESLCESTEKEIEKTVKELENVFSATENTAEVYSFNNRKSETFTPSADFLNAVKKAKKGYEITKGAFDITVMPVLEEWGFSDGMYGVPTQEEINTALKYIGFDSLKISGGKITAPLTTKISLGGIAKGCLGDALINKLKSQNVNAILSLGGNIVTIGSRAEGEKWTVAVKNPNSENDYFCTVKVVGETSVVTSGGYERNFEFNGKTYHHIIDPQTGYPAESGILSVTVIGKDGALCDALSTGLYVLGTKKAVKVMETLHDFDYVILTEDKKVYTSLSDDIFSLTESTSLTVIR